MAKKSAEEPKPATLNLPKLEEEVLLFWQKAKIFERSVALRPAEKAYTFYDGPPYATGLPHIGHLLASTVKDVVPRYQTMRGYRVERRFGWDCHGLPIEVLVEKELKLKSKKDIEKMGIDKFNEICRSTVLRYVDEWKRTITRFGRWVDFENDYKTMDPSYMESAIWVFSELYKKGLVYEDYRSSLYCTRCETPLSKMETTMDDSYRDIDDVSVTVGFESEEDANTFYLAWTTTPWTLSANVALAVSEELEYVTVEIIVGDEPWSGRRLVLAKERLSATLNDGSYRVVETMSGADLVGKRYKPMQPFVKPDGDAYRIVASETVSANDGVGIVHIAPAFGEEDFEIGKREQLPVLLTVNEAGLFLPEITPWAGQHIKAADPSIIAALQKQGVLLKTQTIRHSYPFCWRCQNPLIYKVQRSWYVKVSAVKDKMLKTNEDIHWVPEHLKHGRFKLGIENAPDWGVSRARFWGIPIPVWRCDRCESERVVGSLEELEKLTGKRPTDLHRPAIDEVFWACSCGGTFLRVKDIFDVWFDSGCMPYGQVHYPFENKEKFENTFPADYIAEYVNQTRGWYYYLHVLSNALFGKAAFKHVVNTGVVLAEDGSKMSKSKGNMPDSNMLLEKYGADAMRLWLLQPPILQGEEVNYSEEAIAEFLRKVLLPLWNVYSFFALYAPAQGKIVPVENPTHVLDRWILARLEEVQRDIEEGMEKYELWRAVKVMTPFVNDLSTWYVRRSRDRFKGEDAADRDAAIATLHAVLLKAVKLFAPFAPFLTETLYQKLKGWSEGSLDSVHLEDWPSRRPELIDEALLMETAMARRVIEIGHALRAQEKIKVRQPLGTVWVSGLDISESLRSIVLEELNVKTWGVGEMPTSDTVKKITDEAGTTVAFETAMSEELVREGLRREFVRQINALRKKQGFTIKDRAKITYSTESVALEQLFASDREVILRETLALSIEKGNGTEEVVANNEVAKISLSKA